MKFLTRILSPVFTPRQREFDTLFQKAAVNQREQLSGLIECARNTEWGRAYDFRTIRSYETFRRRVPLQTYDDIKPYVQRMINGEPDILWPGRTKWFAQSSGTTNDKSKFIPVTHDILQEVHYRGGFDSVALYLKQNPESRFFDGKGLILGGSHKPSLLNRHANCGDLSAVLLQNLSPLVDLIRVPGKKIILMDEWESKIRAIVKGTIRKHVNNLSGVPSWMLVLIKAVLKESGKEYLNEVWPDMEVFFHGGISFEPYREQYKTLIPSDKMHYVETYNASEGFFSIQDDPSDKSMLLMTDYGIFYEFIPMDKRESATADIIPLEEVEVGKNYAMVISTCGGLWRYQIGDTVRFTSVFPHKIVISGRTKHYINAFGEELMVDNADKGLSRACAATGAKVKEYTVAPLFMLNKAKGRHQWFIEFEKEPESIAGFAALLDKALQDLNSDYEAKRYKEISLQPLEVIVAREDAFYDWLKGKGKLGGQHKIPRLSNDRTYMDELLKYNI